MPNPIRAFVALVFIAVPLLEIALLIKIGQAIGFWATILIVIGTAIIGTWLLHRQGLQTIHHVLEAVETGKTPVTPVLDGLLLLVAGLLLLTPGIITDTLGFLLLVPPIRNLLVRHALSRLFVVTVSGRARPEPEPEPMVKRAESRWRSPARPRASSDGPGSSTSGPVIDGDYERIDEPPADRKHRNS